MKKLFLILVTTAVCAVSFSQVIPKEQASSTQALTWEDVPHMKGNWQFLFREYAGYNNREYEFMDIDQGSESMFNLNIGTKYFVADHIAIGAELMYESDKIKSVLDAVNVTNDWMAWGNFTYMTGLSGNINIYGEAGIGFGGIKQSYEYQNIDESESYSKFGYKLAVGLPIRVSTNSPLYLTPELQYRGLSTDYDNGKEKENRFGLNFMFETYLPCRAKGWDTNGRWSSDRYRQGQSFLGFTTRAGIMFGSNTFEYDDDFEDEEADYFAAKFGGEYMYYVVNHLALGAQVRFNTRKWEYGGDDNSEQVTRISFAPTVEYNFPGKARNLFIRGAFGFGSDKYTDTYLGEEEEETIKFTEWGAHLGYNIFMARRISLTPILGYESRSDEIEGIDEKQKGSGIDFSLGMRYHF